ncbi:TonB-dependent copper receptor [Pseudoalteromonas fenneropenaei]|uniref:TonB-dependent copper receptor n=1 Tax=Pseudoalteromonas fenneropenaei TaxID=1737459 RepID=A0ABV7CIK6_9GAMM
MQYSLLTLAMATTLSLPTKADEIEKIVVITPMQTPLKITTDPKLPRQPLPAQDGADLLSSIAGFSLVKKGAASGDPVFRGMAGSRLAILTDGGMTLGGCGSRMDPPTAYITPQSYDTLTIIKGPQSVQYGPGSSAATVIFSRDKHRLDQAGITGFANTVLGSDGRHGINSDVQFGNRSYNARIATSYQTADDYQDGDNQRIHSAYDKWNADAEFAYTPDDDTSYRLSLGKSDGNVAYADRMMDGSLFERSHAALKFDLGALSGVVQSLQGQIYYNYVDHVMDNYSLRPFIPSMMMKMPMAANPDRHTQGAKLQATSTLDTAINLVYGFDFQYNTHRNRNIMNAPMVDFNTVARITDAEFEQTGLYGEITYPIDAQAQWVAGLRVDFWQAKDKREQITTMMAAKPNPTSQQARHDTLSSGFVRYQWQTATSSYYIGFGRSERFPDYWELVGSGRGAVDSLSAFNTRSEKNHQFDIGMIQQGQQWQTSTALFYNRVDDYILLDNAYAKMGMPTSVTRNIDSESYGLEVELQYALSTKLNWQSALSYVYGSNLTDHRPLAQQPPLAWRNSLRFDWQQWQFGLLWQLTKAQHRVALAQGNIAGQDVAKSAGFGTLALNTNYSYSDSVTISAGIDNLFDKTYAEHLSRAGAAVSGYSQVSRVNAAGRTLWLNLDWRF